MQPHSRAAALLFSAACASLLCPAVALSVAAGVERQATAWLRSHRNPPQPDELAELKTANPEAYAIVKALLTKRSLGLLDPKHPTASFAGPPAAQAESAEPSGAAAFAKIAEESGEKPKVAPLYPEVQGSAGHHDWLSWKPQQSALEDESALQSVAGAAGEAEDQPREDAPARPEARQIADVPVASAVSGPDASPAATVSDKQPVASMNQENSYLKETEFGIAAPQEPTQNSVSDNSYLKAVDLDGGNTPTHSPVVALSSAGTSVGSGSYLSSFSWDDESPAARNVQAAPVTKPTAKKDALLAWLSPKQVHRVGLSQPPALAQENSYLKDLEVN